jgi:hypothetical protein
VAPLEPHVDAVLGSLCRTFSERFAGEGKFGEPFNFGEWMIFCMYRHAVKLDRRESVTDMAGVPSCQMGGT